jgi:transcription antitermination factor NusG
VNAVRKEWIGQRPLEWMPRVHPRAVPSEVARHWYVGTVLAGTGVKVVEELHARDYEAYEPRTRSWDRRGRGTRFEVSRPLFTGYLFVGVADGQGFGQLHEIAGMGALLKSTGSPREIPFEPIDLLRQAEIRGEFDFTRKSAIDYRPGHKVRVSAKGSYEGLIGEIRRAKGERRWQIFLECMSIPLTLSEDDIEPET